MQKPRDALDALRTSHAQLAARFYRSLDARLVMRGRHLIALISLLNGFLARERSRQIGELSGAAVPMQLVDSLASV